MKETNLIILSGGCHVSQGVFQEHISGEDRVKLVMSENHEGWPYTLHNLGVKSSKDLVRFLRFLVRDKRKLIVL
jgi:hypothetical protein